MVHEEAHRQVLEQPRPHDVCGHFGEDPSFLIVPSVSVTLVLLSCAGGGHASIKAIAWRESVHVRLSSHECFLLQH